MVRDLSSEVNPLPPRAHLIALGETQTRYQVSLVSIDVDRLTLVEAPRLSLRSPVKVMGEGRVWLGEVIQSGSEKTVIEILHSIVNPHELTGLADDFTESDQPERALLS